MDNPYSGDTIFALDIGTRTVIGIVCKKEGANLKIIAESIMEHGSRSMIDGQVHDIDRVAQVVEKVKQELEAKVGFPLREVAIAAAGRTLKTSCVHVEQELVEEIEIDSDIINGLELTGVSQASKGIHSESKLIDESFYCVGYSVVSYYLNGYPITSLLEHRGKLIGADVLATFLPHSVVNSLYKVLEKCSLTPVSLTLEPIAALEAIVPENIRLLNIALIDIGAGTSDIAITKGGAITAYGMVSVAGDEVTEAVAEKYLLDFNTAETIKRSAVRKKKISFKDITGTKVSVQPEEVLSVINNTVEGLAKEVSKNILSLNGDSPRAVFCVGGGSQTPGIIDALSKELNMDKQRIAVKKRTAIPNLDKCGKLVDGPEGVTAVGIAIVAFKKVGHDFINIFVNGKEHRLFNSGDLKVKDVLGIIGYDPSALIGKSGRSVKFTLNGESRRVHGQSSEPTVISVNGSEVSMDTFVKAGDSINIKNAVNGKDASPSIGDYISGYPAIHFTLDGQHCTIEPVCCINENEASADTLINDGDIVNIQSDSSIAAYTAKHGINISNKSIKANGRPVNQYYTITEGDTLTIQEGDSSVNFALPVHNSKSNGDSSSHSDRDGSVYSVNNQYKSQDNRDSSVQFGNNHDKNEHYTSGGDVKPAIVEPNQSKPSGSCINVTVNGKNISMPGEKHIFIDIFNYYELDLSSLNGGAVKVTVNGKNAEYSQPLFDGDIVEIK